MVSYDMNIVFHLHNILAYPRNYEKFTFMGKFNNLCVKKKEITVPFSEVNLI